MSDQSHSHPTPGLYLVILLSLIVGTCLTWGIAFVDLGKWNPVSPSPSPSSKRFL